MSTRVRQYQNGCLYLEPRKTGPSVWVFRWWQQTPIGTVNRKKIVGTVAQYRTKSAASKAVEQLRMAINKQSWQPTKVAELVDHYMERELSEGSNKAYSTRQVYRVCLNRWVRPAWGDRDLLEVKPIPVAEWLAALPLAPGSKAKLRNIFSALFTHAMRYEWLDRNPIALVRQSAKRLTAPEVLDVPELQRLLLELKNPFRTMVFLAASTGLRVSELLALKWADLDFVAGEINLRRAIFHQVIGAMKTETSRKPLPLDSGLAKVLTEWRAHSAYNQSDDWVFASPDKRGQQPYWPDSAMRKHVRPAAVRAGITKRIGWHTFRHTYATLLKGNGEDVKVVQELLRHANSRTTLDTYTQAVTLVKRQAQRKVVDAIRSAEVVEAEELFPDVPKSWVS